MLTIAVLVAAVLLAYVLSGLVKEVRKLRESFDKVHDYEICRFDEAQSQQREEEHDESDRQAANKASAKKTAKNAEKVVATKQDTVRDWVHLFLMLLLLIGIVAFEAYFPR